MVQTRALSSVGRAPRLHRDGRRFESYSAHMAVISIVGTSGVGKSFLVAQLAALNGMPAFLEGEEGVIPEEIFTNVFSNDPVQRYEYFVDRYSNQLSRARVISESGLDVYVDGAALSPEAIMQTEAEQHHVLLREVIQKLQGLDSDLIVLLVASREWLRDAIRTRGRSTEQHEEALVRSLAVQESYCSLLSSHPHVLNIDRSSIDFKDEKSLREINATIKSRLS